MIRNKLVPVESLPYGYKTEKMGDVVFVIYSHKDKPVSLKEIEQAKRTMPFLLKIESIGGFIDYFDFPISESVGVENSLHNRSPSPAVNRKPSISMGYQRSSRSR